MTASDIWCYNEKGYESHKRILPCLYYFQGIGDIMDRLKSIISKSNNIVLEEQVCLPKVRFLTSEAVPGCIAIRIKDIPS